MLPTSLDQPAKIGMLATRLDQPAKIGMLATSLDQPAHINPHILGHIFLISWAIYSNMLAHISHDCPYTLPYNSQVNSQ